MDHSKVNQQHHSPNSHPFGSTTHQHTSPNHNFHNFNSPNNFQSDVNPLGTSVNSIYGSSVLPQPSDGILDLEIGMSWCTNRKISDRHLPDQGTFFRSRSLDDLNTLILHEDHHHSSHHHHHHHHQHNHQHQPHNNHLQNQFNSLFFREDHHHTNHHPHPRHTPNENGIFNQPMLSSANCDIENVLQKISRLEM